MNCAYKQSGLYEFRDSTTFQKHSSLKIERHSDEDRHSNSFAKMEHRLGRQQARETYILTRECFERFQRISGVTSIPISAG